jgi:glycerol-3-phosphate O-acyltransferase / dihydroxyacetone phosphate acyltransferase
MPRRFDVPLAALAQYTVPLIPPENPWVERKPEPTPAAPTLTTIADAKTRRRRKAPTRRLVRHVLRARTDAVRALAGLLTYLETEAPQRQLVAAPHLARAYGGRVQSVPPSGAASEIDAVEKGVRSAGEVVRFLRAKGARVAGLEEPIEGDWVSLSPGELSPGSGLDSEREEPTWVAPTRR